MKVVLFALLFAACSVEAGPRNVTLCWKNATTRMNGAPLTLSEIKRTLVFVEKYGIGDVTPTSPIETFKYKLQDYRKERAVRIYHVDTNGLIGAVLNTTLGKLESNCK